MPSASRDVRFALLVLQYREHAPFDRIQDQVKKGIFSGSYDDLFQYECTNSYDDHLCWLFRISRKTVCLRGIWRSKALS